MAEDNSSGPSGVDRKPKLTLEVSIIDNSDKYCLTIRVKPSTAIYKVIKTWAERFEQNMEHFVFIYDGEPIVLKDAAGQLTQQTVADLGIDANCQIDAMLHQEGGNEIPFP